MNLQTGKETIYKQDFQTSLENANQPEWLKNLRENAFAYFTENGFPTNKDENWKYTNVAPIAKEDFQFGETADLTGEKIAQFVADESKQSILVFTNGSFNKGLSNLEAVKDTTILSFSEAAKDEKFGGIFKAKLGAFVDFEKNGFAALNTAFIGDGVFIHLPKNVKIDAPIQFLFFTDDGKVSFPRVLVVVESFAEATFIESYLRTDETKYLTDAVIEISLADEAKIKHYRVQRESHSAFHIGTTGTEIGRGSVYDTTNINLGAKLSRHDINFKFNAEGGEAFIDGLYMIGDDQHHDTHSVIDHALPNCVSHQTYKGIVDGKAHAVFNGKIFVRENA
ncbi:MAG: SufD family Fe-S cluster assembly protein, partial [Acidobacteriota bacterium]